MNIQLIMYADAQDRARRTSTGWGAPVSRGSRRYRRSPGRVWAKLRREPSSAPATLLSSVAWI